MKERLQSSDSVTIHVPMTFVIRGGRKAIIPAQSAVQSMPVRSSRTDNALLKALAKAYRWRQMIEDGEHASITDLAKAENVNQSYACRILRLTLLAPSIIAEILDGKTASDLMLKRIMKPLPARWDEQITALARPPCSD
jgi:hypothetical protein